MGGGVKSLGSTYTSTLHVYILRVVNSSGSVRISSNGRFMMYVPPTISSSCFYFLFLLMYHEGEYGVYVWYTWYVKDETGDKKARMHAE